MSGPFVLSGSRGPSVVWCDPPTVASERVVVEATPPIAVVFDLDDTLYSERMYAFSGFRAVAQAFEELLGDCAQNAARMRELFDSPHRRRVFDQILIEHGLQSGLKTHTRRMIDTYRQHRPVVTLHADAVRALARCAGCVKLGLISDGPAVMQRAKIDALGLTRRFDAIILTDELGAGLGKPHPRAFELMAERLSTAHARCVYVADNAAKDFVAPNALGWRTIRIVRADGVYRDAGAAAGGTPQHIVRTLDELDACIAPDSFG
jgi:putative hydrolase of the HAD superfamily